MISGGKAEVIDLRSDTLTLPSEPMRRAMAEAQVGDDQYGEDPSVNRLQELVAELLGKERALWMPSGTMANQAALLGLTRPGDDVIVSRESHAVWHEAGAGAANAGVQFTEIGDEGVFSLAQFEAAIKPKGHMIYPGTSLVQIENTHNRAGGVVFPQAEARAICEAARERGIASYLDGARLWNASVATGASAAELAEPFDLVSVAFSKGLGAPGGSVLAGSVELIARAHRARRRLGGAMRQVGVFAAACLYALDHHLVDLAADHANARLIADVLAANARVILDASRVKTNIVVFRLKDDGPDAFSVVERAAKLGVRVFAFGPRTVRLVTHRDVSAAQCARAARILDEATANRG